MTMTQTPAETRSPHFNRDATAATYRDIHLPRVFAPWARVLLEIVPPRPGEAVVDVATGPGTVARQAAARVGTSGRVVGVDISPAMLFIARQWPPEPRAADIQYVESSATKIPLDDEAFDIAYCQQGLQHMSDPATALQEIYRVLKSGGRMGVAIWRQSPFSLFRQVVADMGFASDGAQPSTFGRDPEELSEALAQAGFTGVEVHTRQLVSVLEGGIPQALEVAVATSAANIMGTLSSAQQNAIKAAIARELEPLARDDGVHLISIANIASARRIGATG
jgi:SAM-dependent methyltransferase